MNEMLKNEFEYFLANKENLVKDYEGKFIVIKDRKVIGAYDTEAMAVKETAKEHALGTFLVQECSLSEDSYTQTFHSRVAIG